MESGIKIAYTARDEVIYLGCYGFGFRVLVLPIPEMKAGRVVIRGAGRQANKTSSLPLLGFFLFAPPSLLPSRAILPPFGLSFFRKRKFDLLALASRPSSPLPSSPRRRCSVSL